MPTVTLQATKMSDAKVSHVSLVARGANRTPFKVIKQENPMNMNALDLGRLIKKADKPTLSVLGVITLKGEHTEALAEQIKAAGFLIDQRGEVVEKGEEGSEDTTTVVFKQAEDISGEAIVIKMSEDVALVCKGFSPYMMDMASDGMSFSDQVAAQGFYPSISTVMDTARSVIVDTVQKADSPAAASASVASMMGEVTKYAQSMVAALPSKCFKLESCVVPEPVAKEETPAVVAPVITAPVVKAEEKPAETPPVVEPVVKAEEKPVQSAAPAGVTIEQVQEVIAKSSTDMATAFSKQVTDLFAGLNTSVQKSIDAVTKSVTDMGARVEKAEAAVKATEAVVKGSLVTGSDAGDELRPNATKSESGSQGRGEFDTAYTPRSQRQARR